MSSKPEIAIKVAVRVCASGGEIAIKMAVRVCASGGGSCLCVCDTMDLCHSYRWVFTRWVDSMHLYTVQAWIAYGQQITYGQQRGLQQTYVLAPTGNAAANMET